MLTLFCDVIPLISEIGWIICWLQWFGYFSIQNAYLLEPMVQNSDHLSAFHYVRFQSDFVFEYLEFFNFNFSIQPILNVFAIEKCSKIIDKSIIFRRLFFYYSPTSFTDGCINSHSYQFTHLFNLRFDTFFLLPANYFFNFIFAQKVLLDMLFDNLDPWFVCFLAKQLVKGENAMLYVAVVSGELEHFLINFFT